MWRFLAGAAKTFGLVHLIDSYIFSFGYGHGPSMLPTFNSTGDIFLEERLSHRFGRLVPGDVVVVRSPDNPKMMVAKRIIGLEGDKVKFFDPHRILFQHGSSVKFMLSVNLGGVIIRFLRGMFGFRETTLMNPMIHGHMDLCLTVLFKAGCFSGYGRLMILDSCVTEWLKVLDLCQMKSVLLHCLWDFRRPLGFDFREIYTLSLSRCEYKMVQLVQ